MCIIPNSLEISHRLIRKVVKPGDVVIDATAGNGNDTVFLAELTGPGGKVYAFDIQNEALSRTKTKLAGEGFDEWVRLINDGHENMDHHVCEKVKAVMFNLGYLPRGDHTIGTKGCTTIKALEKAMDLLDPDGLITVVVYYGGDSGFDEKEQLLDYIRNIDYRKFTVMQTEFVNQPNCPPILVCIEKLKQSAGGKAGTTCI